MSAEKTSVFSRVVLRYIYLSDGKRIKENGDVDILKDRDYGVLESRIKEIRQKRFRLKVPIPEIFPGLVPSEHYEYYTKDGIYIAVNKDAIIDIVKLPS